MGQQYLQIYGVPGAVNATVYPYGQLGQPLPTGHGYTPVQGYAMPGQHIVQFSGPTGVTAAPLPTIQASYPAGNNIHRNHVIFSFSFSLFLFRKRTLVPHSHTQTKTQGVHNWIGIHIFTLK